MFQWLSFGSVASKPAGRYAWGMSAENSLAAKIPPPLHQALVHQFVGSATTRWGLYPVNLDVKQAEIVRCLLADGRRTRISADYNSQALPVFLSTDAEFERLYLAMKPAVAFVLDLHDKGRRLDFLDIPDSIYRTMAEHDLAIVYLKLQIHDPARYVELNRDPGRLHVLSMPLLLGGSRFHVTVQPDFAGDALFRNMFRSNPHPHYEYDWSYVGSPTSDDRAAAMAILKEIKTSRGFLTVSTPGHTDAAQATVPHVEYIRISRASRIGISLNGRGPWCLKDGELFCSDCLVMRQWHPTIEINPFSPRDGRDWVVFKTEEIASTIDLLLSDPSRRDTIRRGGHDLLRQVLFESLWSQPYVDALEAFVTSRSKDAWGKLAVA
jgi:hypothetical protein